MTALRAARLAIVLLTMAAPAGAQWLNYPTPGLPRLPNGMPDLAAPPARTADGRIDLSGIWIKDAATLDYFYDLAKGLPPGDVVMTPPGTFKILQTPNLVALLYDLDTNPTFRQVHTDGRPLPKDPEPTWLGYSIGRWEGDELVVTTAGFRDGGWLDTQR